MNKPTTGNTLIFYICPRSPRKATNMGKKPHMHSTVTPVVDFPPAHHISVSGRTHTKTTASTKRYAPFISTLVCGLVMWAHPVRVVWSCGRILSVLSLLITCRHVYPPRSNSLTLWYCPLRVIWGKENGDWVMLWDELFLLNLVSFPHFGD